MDRHGGEASRIAVPPFPWLYPYEEEQRVFGAEFIREPLLRPVVAVRILGPERPSERLIGLVDSGADHVLMPEWLGHAVGLTPDPDREIALRIGGAERHVRFSEATLRLCCPGDLFEDCDQGFEWEAEVGFFTDWPDPAWLVVLGQRGFFDAFTVTMSRFAMNVAVTDREEFDRRFGIQPASGREPERARPRL